MAQNNKPNKSGRKPLVDKEVDLIFRKLEPYLKKGLSLHKACLEAKIPSSRTGAKNLELLIPLVDSILKHWNPAIFHPEVLNSRDRNYPQIYVF